MFFAFLKGKATIFLHVLCIFKGQGYYLFIETSSPRRPNDTARLESPTLPGQTLYSCLRFWYHMYGPEVNTLNVYTKVGNTLGTPVWKHTGTIDNRWHFQEVDISSMQAFKVIHVYVYFVFLTVAMATNGKNLKLLSCLYENIGAIVVTVVKAWVTL